MYFCENIEGERNSELSIEVSFNFLRFARFTFDGATRSMLLPPQSCPGVFHRWWALNRPFNIFVAHEGSRERRWRDRDRADRVCQPVSKMCIRLCSRARASHRGSFAVASPRGRQSRVILSNSRPPSLLRTLPALEYSLRRIRRLFFFPPDRRRFHPFLARNYSRPYASRAALNPVRSEVSRVTGQVESATRAPPRRSNFVCDDKASLSLSFLLYSDIVVPIFDPGVVRYIEDAIASTYVGEIAADALRNVS